MEFALNFPHSTGSFGATAAAKYATAKEKEAADRSDENFFIKRWL